MTCSAAAAAALLLAYYQLLHKRRARAKQAGRLATAALRIIIQRRGRALANAAARSRISLKMSITKAGCVSAHRKQLNMNERTRTHTQKMRNEVVHQYGRDDAAAGAELQAKTLTYASEAGVPV